MGLRDVDRKGISCPIQFATIVTSMFNVDMSFYVVFDVLFSLCYFTTLNTLKAISKGSVKIIKLGFKNS